MKPLQRGQVHYFRSIAKQLGLESTYAVEADLENAQIPDNWTCPFSVIIIFVFVPMLGGAGAILGMSYLYVSRSRFWGTAAIWFGTILGLSCGVYLGFDGLGGGAATGSNWYGQPVFLMPLVGLGVFVVAVFCLSFAMRLTRA